MASISPPKTETIGGRYKYEVEDDLRALRNASKIKNTPSRLKAVKILVKEEMGALEKIANDKTEGFSSEY